MISLQHSLAQYSYHVYDEWSDITPLNVESVITKPPLKVEPKPEFELEIKIQPKPELDTDTVKPEKIKTLLFG